MKIKRNGSAVWHGSLKEGRGHITTQSEAIKDYPYGFAARFENQKGTNPEELIGAAHAGCFTMALSMILGQEGLTAERMETKADVTLEQKDGGFEITGIHLMLKASVPNTNPTQFKELAEKAKAGCPVSKLFKAPITLDAQLA